MGSYFEGYWGRTEFLRHFAITVVGTNVITYMIMILRNIFFEDEDDLFQLINGLGSFLDYIKPLSTFVYRFMVKLKFLPPLPPRPQFVDPEAQSVPSPPPRRVEEVIFESTQSDADRRKALALEALNSRLQQS
ncbi:hypothetical protein HDV04_000684 [Boothiomyces sp. JEL0838]|nr:hypothetical protein HDV04_000668 [Boothiomyces sp. JEL0838]KAJ3314318.1 hypothetical protein HDV04_000684 [Boothiomyces sp. JEL0838]